MRVIISALALSLVVLSGCGRDAHLAGSKPVSTVEYYAQPGAGPLSALVARQAAQAKTPILYFYADWCGPCRRFRETLADEQVQAALQNATLIKINIDKDAQGLAEKYGVQAVPTFVKVDTSLAPLALISGDKWDEDVPENIAPVMHNLAATRTYDNPSASAKTN